MKSALVLTPFNDPTMPPLGIATLLGYLRPLGYDLDPLDLNLDVFSRIRHVLHRQPTQVEKMRRSWCHDPFFQNVAASLAFPEYMPELGHPQWETLLVKKILENCLTSASKFLRQERYDVVGISVTNVGFLSAVALSRYLKNLDSGIFIVWGGPLIHPRFSFTELARIDEVDLFVYGSGEKVLENILKRLQERDSRSNLRWDDLPGVVLQDDRLLCIEDWQHETKTTVSAHSDFTSFPLWLYDDLHLPIITASGCPWSKCKFCSEPALTKHFNPKPIKEISVEITSLEKIQVKHSLYFVDNCLNATPNRLRRLCDLLISAGSPPWTGMFRSEGLTKELIKQMKDSGCHSIFVGLESLSDNLLESMGKGCSKIDHLKVFRIAQEVGIHVMGNFMIGYPAETVENLIETIDILKRYRHLWRLCRFWISSYVVTPGSYIFEKPDEHNVKILEWGDETVLLSEPMRNYVPVWSFHWISSRNADDNLIDKYRLYYELQSLLQSIQKKHLPRKSLMLSATNPYILSESETYHEVSKILLDKIQVEILQACMEPITINKLGKSIVGSNDNLAALLREMEHKGWICKSDDRIVTTVPLMEH